MQVGLHCSKMYFFFSLITICNFIDVKYAPTCGLGSIKNICCFFPLLSDNLAVYFVPSVSFTRQKAGISVFGMWFLKWNGVVIHLR